MCVLCSCVSTMCIALIVLSAPYVKLDQNVCHFCRCRKAIGNAAKTHRESKLLTPLRSFRNLGSAVPSKDAIENPNRCVTLLHDFSSPHLFVSFISPTQHRHTKHRCSPKRGILGTRFSLTNFSMKRSSLTGFPFGRKFSSGGSKSSSVIVPFRENADDPMYNISSYNIQVFVHLALRLRFCLWASSHPIHGCCSLSQISLLN